MSHVMLMPTVSKRKLQPHMLGCSGLVCSATSPVKYKLLSLLPKDIVSSECLSILPRLHPPGIMSFINRFVASLLSGHQETTLALAEVNFDFSLVKAC